MVAPRDFTIEEAAEKVAAWKNQIEIDTFDKQNEIFEGKENVIVNHKGKEITGTVVSINKNSFTFKSPSLAKKITKKFDDIVYV